MGYGICGNTRLGPLAEPLKDNSVKYGSEIYLGDILPPDKLIELQDSIDE